MRSLRSEWQESRTTKERGLQFQSRYGFADLAEDKLSLLVEGRIAPKEFFAPSKDIALSQLQLSVGLGTDPFDLGFLSSLTSRALTNMTHRPWDALNIFIEDILYFIFPFFFAFLVAISFHVLIWSKPLMHDLPRFMRGDTAFPLVVALLATLMAAAIFKQWLAFASLWGFMSLTYSRDKIWSILLAIGLSLSLTLWTQAPSLRGLFFGTETVEALREGRTRLEYSEASLKAMPPFERALWAYQNRDSTSARAIIASLPSEPRVDMMRVILDEATSNPEELLKKFEALPSADTDALTLFNRSQLSIRSHQLIQSDQLRSKISPQELGRLSQKASRQDQSLLIPDPILPSEIITLQSEQLLSAWLQQSGFKPWTTAQAFKSCLLLLHPYLLLLLVIFWRRRCSGLCRHTGAPTLTRDFDTSSRIQALTQRADTGGSSSRVQLEMEMRGYQLLKNRESRHWSWLYPEIMNAYEGQSLAASWLKTSCVYSLLWYAISPQLQTSILSFVTESRGTRLNHSYSTLLFGSIFLIVYTGLFIRAWRRSAE